MKSIFNLVKIAGAGLLFFGVAFVVGFRLSRTILPDSQARAANIILDQPTYNWFVCEDLGLGTIPGVPDLRQILRLCHNQGWEIRTYCLQPSLPAPPLGTSCSHTPEGTYWCGDNYQLLEEFVLDVTPTSSPVPSETNTSIPTQTPQPSATQTPSQTFTSTATSTPTEIPTDTPPPTLTPRPPTRTPPQTRIATNTPIPSVSATNISTQTPMATQTDIPVSSVIPTDIPSPTSQNSGTSTPVVLTETPLSILSATPTIGPTLRSDTPVATATYFVNTPVPTERPRPGGSGNFAMIGLLGGALGILSFGIGFLGLLLIQKSRLAFRVTHNLPSGLPPGSYKLILLNRGIILLLLVGMISMVGYLIFVWVPNIIVGQPGPKTISMISMLSIEDSLTATPFQPQHPTPVYAIDFETIEPPTFDFQQFSFMPQSTVFQISIDPPSPEVNQGKPIKLAFIPANICIFGDQQACVSAHRIDHQNLVFLTVHSGYGGEGQGFRHAVEGTGINRAGFSLDKVDAHLNALQGAQVSISEEDDEAGGFLLRGVIRIPASQVEAYFALPIEEALKLAASLNPEVWSTIDQQRALFIFETCGWKLPSEPGSGDVSDTTGSVYIAVIQPIP